MQVGDLIRYNAAGMRNKTLGLILQKGQTHEYMEPRPVCLIQWCIIGEYMPRVAWGVGQHTWGDKVSPGALCWHLIGPWFEVVDENR